MTSNLWEAYSFLQTLRVRAQALKLRQGQPPDNMILPSRLSSLERDRLKDCLKIVAEFQDFCITNTACGFSPSKRKEKRVREILPDPCFLVAGPTRLELAPSDVTGRRYNQLNYGPACRILVGGTGLEPVTPGL